MLLVYSLRNDSYVGSSLKFGFLLVRSRL